MFVEALATSLFPVLLWKRRHPGHALKPSNLEQSIQNEEATPLRDSEGRTQRFG